MHERILLKFVVGYLLMGFPGSSLVKSQLANGGDEGSIPGLGRSPGEGNGNPLQYSCLENPIDREALSRWMPVSPGASGMQPRDPCRPWRGRLASGHKPR